MEREEFYRLKKISNKKERDQAAADAELAKKKKKNGQNGEEQNGNDQEPVDVLGEHEDDDVIF